MSLHLTPDMLESAYELLRTTPPFKRWKLPPGDELEFHVFGGREHAGDYQRTATGHRIRVNANWCGSLPSLLRIMAHEMTHLYLEVVCPGDQAHHGRRFNACAASICRHHVMDPKTF